VDPDQSDQSDQQDQLVQQVNLEVKEKPELLVLKVPLALLEQSSPTLPQPPLPIIILHQRL